MGARFDALISGQTEAQIVSALGSPINDICLLAASLVARPSMMRWDIYFIAAVQKQWRNGLPPTLLSRPWIVPAKYRKVHIGGMANTTGRRNRTAEGMNPNSSSDASINKLEGNRFSCNCFQAAFFDSFIRIFMFSELIASSRWLCYVHPKEVLHNNSVDHEYHYPTLPSPQTFFASTQCAVRLYWLPQVIFVSPSPSYCYPRRLQ